MASHIDLVSLVVDDYDAAIEFYVGRAGFELVEDSPVPGTVEGRPKRWVVVRPPGARTGLLLALASGADQRAAVGRHAGGRVGLFLTTDDFDRTYRVMVESGVVFVEGPRQEHYGRVAIWRDLYGNRWDLIEAADPHWTDPHIGATLVSAAAIASRIGELGRQITADYAGRTPLLVAVLKGSMVFMSDLMRAIEGPVEIDVLAVSSYGAATKSTGVVRIVKDLDHDVADRDVILVEDIVDSGLTMRYLLDRLSSQGPASLKTCALLVREIGPGADDGPGDQGARGNVSGGVVPIDYQGFGLPATAFVIGYGLDAGERYRNLPYVASYVPD
jgi:hypoxanthine phosphoribosyltransferase